MVPKHALQQLSPKKGQLIRAKRVMTHPEPERICIIIRDTNAIITKHTQERERGAKHKKAQGETGIDTALHVHKIHPYIHIIL
jgi:hypothetical protein